MSVIEIVRIPVAQVRLNELGEVVAAARRDYLAPPVCESTEVFGSGDGGELIAVVRWASRADHESAKATAAAAAFFGRVGELAAGPPSVSYFERLG